MQTIKGLITLLFVAAVVFTGVLIFNRKTEPAYVAKVKQTTLANTDKSVNPAAIEKTSSVETHHKMKKANLSS